MSLPNVVSREEWLDARRRLLAQEKEPTGAMSPSTPAGAGCPWSRSTGCASLRARAGRSR